jgi:hypothetical protein
MVVSILAFVLLLLPQTVAGTDLQVPVQNQLIGDMSLEFFSTCQDQSWVLLHDFISGSKGF